MLDPGSSLFGVKDSWKVSTASDLTMLDWSRFSASRPISGGVEDTHAGSVITDYGEKGARRS